MINHLLVALLAAACLSGCQSPDPKVAGGDAAPRGRSATKTVAGTWKFSHLGPSPISEGADELLRVANENLAGARISIEEDGSASMIVAGQSGSVLLEVLEETPIYIRLGASGVESQAPLTYDKSTRLLALPINVDTGGDPKTLPAYFSRR